MISCIKNNPIRFILVVLLTVILNLNYFGYCYSQKRFLSDEEKLNIAVKKTLAIEAANAQDLKRVRSFDRGDGRRLQREKYLLGEPVPYKDISEFFALNPRCCTVSTELSFEGTIAHISRWNRLINTISSVVTVKYLERYRDSKDIIHSKVVNHYWLITNCGDIWDYDQLWSYF